MKPSFPIILLTTSTLFGCVGEYANDTTRSGPTSPATSIESNSSARDSIGAHLFATHTTIQHLANARHASLSFAELADTILTQHASAGHPANSQDPNTDNTDIADKDPSTCPSEMALVSGQYCPNVQHTCLRWLETTGRFARFRCAEYARPAKCVGERRHMHFCMDRYEYTPPGETLPASVQSWTDAQRTCKSLGKRVCLESEWNFACEGEELRPYSYGFIRDPHACNADRTDIYRRDGRLADLRAGRDSHPECVSPFGVHHLTGNLEEWTTIDGSTPERPAMKGAYWQPSRNHCRAAQTAHDRYYKGDETGFRCCKDLE